MYAKWKLNLCIQFLNRYMLIGADTYYNSEHGKILSIYS